MFPHRIAFGVVLFATAIAAAGRCPDGYFEVQGLPLFATADPLATPDAIGVRDGVAGVLSGCHAQLIHAQPTSRAVNLRWDRNGCGAGRRVRLHARFASDCASLVGTLAVKGRNANQRRAFTAVRATPPPGGADPTFGIRGVGGFPFELPFEPYAIAVQHDGGVAIAGRLDTAGALARLRGDGSVDTTFGDGGVARSTDAMWFQVLVDADDRIVVAGQTSTQFAIARYTAAGVLDPTFGANGITTGSAVVAPRLFDVARDPTGGFVLAGAGQCPSDPSDGCAQLLRVDADGHPDPSFGTGGFVIVPPLPSAAFDRGIGFTAVTVEPDRSLLAAGTGIQCPSSDPFPAPSCQVLARFMPDGTPDPDFATAGTAVDVLDARQPNVPSRILHDTGGGILVVGGLREWYYSRVEHGLTRYGATGVLDATFGIGGVLALPPFTDVVPRTAGGFVAAVASSGFTEAKILRLTDDWAPDATFGAGGLLGIGEVARFFAMAAHPDGRITIAAQWNGSVYRRLP